MSRWSQRSTRPTWCPWSTRKSIYEQILHEKYYLKTCFQGQKGECTHNGAPGKVLIIFLFYTTIYGVLNFNNSIIYYADHTENQIFKANLVPLDPLVHLAHWVKMEHLAKTDPLEKLVKMVSHILRDHLDRKELPEMLDLLVCVKLVKKF